MPEPSASPPAQPDRSMFRLERIAILLAALVALNTLVVSCLSDRSTRDAAILQRIDGRERFWTDAMEDLSSLMADRGTIDPEIWESRCVLLAARTAPFVRPRDYYTRGRADDGELEMSPEVSDLGARVYDLQLAFYARMTAEETVGRACVEAFTAEKQRADEKREVIAQADGAPPAAGIVAETRAEETPPFDVDIPRSILDRQSSIELATGDPKGFDIDVFWCDRLSTGAQSVEQALAARENNFKQAEQLATKLALLSRDGTSLMTAGSTPYTLGRIRLRMLASADQATAEYRPQSTRKVIVYDRSARSGDESPERIVAGDIVTRFREPGLTLMRKSGSNDPDWYLSVFFCRHGQPQ